MSTQYVFILPILCTNTSKKLILNYPKDFIQFLSECLVNLFRGELASRPSEKRLNLIQIERVYKKEELI